MTETNEERLDRIENDGGGLIDGDFEWLIEQVEHNQELEKSIQKAIEMQEYYLITNGDLQDENTELKKLLEGNDGMSIKEIKEQFVELHRDWLKLKNENKKLREAMGLEQ